MDEAMQALADIAFSKDMTLKVAQSKAKRVYEATKEQPVSADIVAWMRPTSIG